MIKIEPKVAIHPQPCLLSRIESKSLFIAEEYLTPLPSIGFQDPFWKNFIRRDDRTINIYQPWLYDHNPIVRETFYSYSVKFHGRQIRHHPREPKPRDSSQKSYAPRVKKSLYLTNARGLKQPFKIDLLILALIRRKSNLDPRFSIPLDLDPLSIEILGLF